MNNRDLAKWVKLTTAIRKHEDDAEDLKERRKVLEEALLNNMAKAGIKRVNVDGYTVYIDRKLWAGHTGDSAALVAALREEGMGDIVTESANAMRLSSWVREFDPDNNLPPEDVAARLPERVRAAIKVSEKIQLAMRKG